MLKTCLCLGFVKGFFRKLHLQKPLCVEKTHLAELRRKTGYSLQNCKKALVLYGVDLKQAEEWLHAQAQAEGWTKLSKMQGRTTAHGLIGMKWKKNQIAVIEVNCETDFVSRNNQFQRFVASSVGTIWHQYNCSKPHEMANVKKLLLSGSEIAQMKTESREETLADILAFNVSHLGENLLFKRGTFVETNKNLLMFGYVHPNGNKINDVFLGRYGAWIILRQLQPLDPTSQLEELGMQLCQHIIGMDPSKIGSDDDKPVNCKDEETTFVFQEFLSNPDVTVKELLSQNHLEIVDYQRLKCGDLQ